jgi:hypothetical protein
MSSSTYGGVFREVPILPFPTMSLSLVRGMVVQWGAISQSVGAWMSGNVPLGVCTGDVDRDAGQVSIYVAKGCSVSLKCDVGIVPNPGDLLFCSAPGTVSNASDGNAPFAAPSASGSTVTSRQVVI